MCIEREISGYEKDICDGRKIVLKCSRTAVLKAAVFCIFLMCLSFILIAWEVIVMDRDTIRRMDPELYQEKLEEAVMDDVSCILNVNKGHSSVLHTDISIDDMITRMVKEEKQAVSSFYDAETLVSTLQDAIYYKAKEISN